ncbi:hypothetical protein BDW66DRAFT_125671 [Aspergillus desertorum]
MERRRISRRLPRDPRVAGLRLPQVTSCGETEKGEEACSLLSSWHGSCSSSTRSNGYPGIQSNHYGEISISVFGIWVICFQLPGCQPPLAPG